MRITQMAMAEMAKLSESTMKATHSLPVPTALRVKPARAGPIRMASIWEVWERELAANNCSAGTRLGMSAPLAGLKRVATVDMAKASTQMASRLEAMTAGIISRVILARTMSEKSIVRRRSQ